MVTVVDLLVSAVEIAFIISVLPWSFMETINTPFVMVVSASTFPSISHVTVWIGLLLPFTVAVNCAPEP
jgi:hypothetical protein